MTTLRPTLAATLLALFSPSPALAQQEAGLILRDRRTPVVDVVERARPAVVSIDSSVRQSSLFGVFEQPVSGTGVVIYEDGTIVTNYHVVSNDGRLAKEILVRFDEADDETVYPGRVISTVREEDLALIKIEGNAPFPTIAMSDDEPMLGETVVAIGNAVGQTHTVSTGIISGLHRDLPVRQNDLHFKSLLQTDAAINPGNSGGPLLDINGQLIGINTAITRGAENVGFAIPVARVRWVLANQLLSLEQARSYLGYEIDDETFLVTEVASTGPADLAGLEPGDRVVAFDGKPFDSAEAYSRLLLAVEPGSRVEVAVERAGERRSLDVDAWNPIDGTIHRRLGISVRRILWGASRRPYLQLTGVDPNGPAGRIGLQAGDLIGAIRPRGYRSYLVQRAQDLFLLVSKLDSGTPVEFEIWRDDNGDGSYDRGSRSSELYAGTLRVL